MFTPRHDLESQDPHFCDERALGFISASNKEHVLACGMHPSRRVSATALSCASPVPARAASWYESSCCEPLPAHTAREYYTSILPLLEGSLCLKKFHTNSEVPTTLQILTVLVSEIAIVTSCARLQKLRLVVPRSASAWGNVEEKKPMLIFNMKNDRDSILFVR